MWHRNCLCPLEKPEEAVMNALCATIRRYFRDPTQNLAECQETLFRQARRGGVMIAMGEIRDVFGFFRLSRKRAVEIEASLRERGIRAFPFGLTSHQSDVVILLPIRSSRVKRSQATASFELISLSRMRRPSVTWNRGRATTGGGLQETDDASLNSLDEAASATAGGPSPRLEAPQTSKRAGSWSFRSLFKSWVGFAILVALLFTAPFEAVRQAQSSSTVIWRELAVRGAAMELLGADSTGPKSSHRDAFLERLDTWKGSGSEGLGQHASDPRMNVDFQRSRVLERHQGVGASALFGEP
jgi:hypothetical protein